MKRTALCLSVLAGFHVCYAQDTTATKTNTSGVEVAGVKITGSLDMYYRYNFANTTDAGGHPVTNNYTSFTNSQNAFELGMASIQATHNFGKASAFIDVGFGRRAEEFNYPDGNIGSGKNGYTTLAAVKQLNVSYAISDKFKLTMGKWATHIGYELVDAYLNRNYSMSYLFSYGPFSHTGLKADIGLGNKSALMVGVTNPTDQATTLSSRKYAIAQFSTGTNNDQLKAYINYQGSYGGSYGLTQFDLVLNGKITDRFSIGYNGTVQLVKPENGNANNWWGSALYLNFDPTSTFGITLRGEYFDNQKQVASAPATSIFDVTLSPNFKIGNLTIIPELRLDAAKEEVFVQHDGSPAKTTLSGILAATYHF
ncbi:porin [Ilyomonas limi]|uniref:Porin n=1 Tax=Ilyomonas limi TaxID=2575867 RepID=A0A4U3KY64_9BACT|nr:outer membrane beta-barrel protein [Ilyomonas limi]TKK67420.1 porin [Ilyomonas limi]